MKKKKILPRIATMVLITLISVETTIPAIAADVENDSVHMEVPINNYVLDYGGGFYGSQ